MGEPEGICYVGQGTNDGRISQSGGVENVYVCVCARRRPMSPAVVGVATIEDNC